MANKIKKEHLIKYWNEKSLFMKIISILGLIISITIIILASLSIMGTIKDVNNIIMPLLGVMMTIQGIQYWKINRPSSIMSFAVAAFIFIVALLILFRRG